MIILGVLSVVVIVSWLVLGSKFAEEKEVTPAQRVKAKAPKVTVAPAMPTEAQLKSMTKAKIEQVGRDLGVELDKRKTKANMISDLFSANV